MRASCLRGRRACFFSAPRIVVALGSTLGSVRSLGKIGGVLSLAAALEIVRLRSVDKFARMVSLLASGLRVSVTPWFAHLLVPLRGVWDLLSRADLLIALTPAKDLVHRRIDRCLRTVGKSRRALHRILCFKWLR